MRSCSPKKRLVSLPSFRVIVAVFVAIWAVLAVDRIAKAAPAPGTDVCYEGGSLLPNFQLNGNAVLDGNDLIVTQSLMGQLSSIMYYPKLSTTNDFHIAFEIKISANVNGGADGMSFVMQNAPAGAGALGSPGGGIGYQGITNSVVVEFDTFKNSWDPDANHVAITKGGDPDHTSVNNTGLPVVSNPAGITNLKSGSPVYVWIDYAHTTTALSVFVSSTTTKPLVATMTTAALDLGLVLGSGSFTIGFTGSTGGAWSKHEIVQLSASDHFTDPHLGCCSGDADCTTSAAGSVCDPIKHLCGACTLAETSCGSSTPACDLSSSANQCAVACNGNFGSVTSQPCPSAAFPACTASGSCATCNGDNQSTGTINCASGAPYCSASGYCGLCTQTSDCTATNAPHSAAVCNVSKGACMACNSDVDCTSISGATPACNSTTQQCVACTAGNTSACTGATPVCATASNKCVACAGDFGASVTTVPHDGGTDASSEAGADASVEAGADASLDAALDGASSTVQVALCPSIAQPYCTALGACTKCTSNADCTAGHPGGICNVATGECGTACTVDGDCPGGWCNNPVGDAGGGSCASKVPNGGPIPSSPPVNSTCTVAVAMRICSSGVCDSSNNLCGEPNGQTCTSAAVCISSVCNADGKCGDPDGSPCTNSTTCRTGVCNVTGACGVLPIMDAGMADAGTPDAGDAGEGDASANEDATVADAEAVDATMADATTLDAGQPTAEASASEDAGDDGLRLQGGGCRCAAAGSHAPADGLSGIGAMLALVGARARRQRRRAGRGRTGN
jgi:hypothetical protein